LGFSNWPVILLHQQTPTSFLAPSSLGPIKFSGAVAREEWKASARGVFARTSFTLFYCFALLYLFTCIVLYQKPKKN
jgi:hypothetical protein